ncbi:NIPSNAP family protein [Mycolicibacterium sp. 120266]|uniref:NIPSNAP family protein n=1 Tax=Mycolicibacterium sp. 120266 TaxID=3090601 RepID=UPI00299CF2D1|nr:NIPSNAP family protein [Mycolicibacterium sp. 120266]MDX1874128.1 NIPSNAP family protein [Mycolicibacterium sp. 120266]
MSVYQWRVYTLKDAQSLRTYQHDVYPRHLGTVGEFDITLHGIWTSPDDTDHRLYVLASYPDGADLESLERAYLQSPAFHQDMAGMDPTCILNVTATRLDPSTGSPLD